MRAGREEKRSPSPSPYGIKSAIFSDWSEIPQGKIPLPPAGGERNS